jgi:two-component system nitrogen regulation sensor histidine kinase NtrY
MKLRIKYILFVFIVHVVTLVLTFFIFKDDKILFLVAEVFVIISILISWNLYIQLIQPLKSLMSGLDAIKDRDFNTKFLPTGKHEVDELIGVYNHMMDQLRTERTLQEQQHFFLEKLITTSPTGIIILNYEEQVQQVNPKALQILGVLENELLDHSIHSFSNPLLQQIGELKSGDSRTVKHNGPSTFKIQKSHFIDRGFPRQFIMIEELTMEILAAEKNVYGKVIRMMAHEVNNTIGPVNSIIQSALKTNDLWVDPHKDLQEALQVAFDRNQNLNFFMRNFADLVKLPEPNKKVVDLNLLIASISKLMNTQAEERNIELHLPTCSTFSILADVQQMEQALLNIVKNAMEAIGNDGRITFDLNVNESSLTIIDTGTGISSAESEQLFSPFFSTKKDGQGIGLTLVREILNNHGFRFSLNTIEPSNPTVEKQTAFNIIFK